MLQQFRVLVLALPLVLGIARLPALGQVPSGAVDTAPSESIPARPSASPPTYLPQRADEDYGYLSDPRKRIDAWDKVKYVSLGRENWYLSFGGEANLFYERIQNDAFGQGLQDPNGYGRHRAKFHADVHLGQQLRFFGELRSDYEYQRTSGSLRFPIEINSLDLQQGFAEWKTRFSNRSSVTLRAGRQTLFFGSQRFIGNSGASRSDAGVRFDGVRATFRKGNVSVDGFVVKPTTYKRGVFDDKTDNARTLWGAYAVAPLPILPTGNVDFYYVGYDRKQAAFDQGTAREIRHTFGARVWGASDGWDYNTDVIGQTGSFGNARIRAYAVASETGYTFQNARWTPRVGFKAEAWSGDRDPNNPQLGTFNPLFPQPDYYGQLNALGPANIINVFPSLEVKPVKNVALKIDWLVVWRASRRDGLYTIFANPYVAGQQSTARFVGSQPGALIKWQVDRHTTVNIGYARFNTNRFLDETVPGGARDINFFSAWINYKF